MRVSFAWNAYVSILRTSCQLIVLANDSVGLPGINIHDNPCIKPSWFSGLWLRVRGTLLRPGSPASKTLLRGVVIRRGKDCR